MRATISIKPEGYPSIAEIQLQIAGRPSEIAAWIDENLIAARCFRGGLPWLQGAATPEIERWLQKGGTYDGLDDSTLTIH